MKETIVISGVNLVNGGPFTILKECLDALSSSPLSIQYNIVALVHKKCLLPNYSKIKLIEFPKSKKNYCYRLYYEYYEFKRLSQKLTPKLWLSLHDMSPIVKTEIQAVYMHNPSPFLGKPKSFTPRGLVFSSLYKWIYRINIHSNNYLIVQQNWLREAFSTMFKVSQDKIIVARPACFLSQLEEPIRQSVNRTNKIFVFASYPRSFKNFEVICKAAKRLVEVGEKRFKVFLTMDGHENQYSEAILKAYGDLENLCFVGLQPHEKMNDFYVSSDCLIFPSKLETWGLPISEYMQYGKPMLLADLPYARETASNAQRAAFFKVDDYLRLADLMQRFINGDESFFSKVPPSIIAEPCTNSWEELFRLLLNGDKC